MLAVMLALSLSAPDRTCNFEKLPRWAHQQLRLAALSCFAATPDCRLFTKKLRRELSKVCFTAPTQEL